MRQQWNKHTNTDFYFFAAFGRCFLAKLTNLVDPGPGGGVGGVLKIMRNKTSYPVILRNKVVWLEMHATDNIFKIAQFLS